MTGRLDKKEKKNKKGKRSYSVPHGRSQKAPTEAEGLDAAPPMPNDVNDITLRTSSFQSRNACTADSSVKINRHNAMCLYTNEKYCSRVEKVEITMYTVCSSEKDGRVHG